MREPSLERFSTDTNRLLLLLLLRHKLRHRRVRYKYRPTAAVVMAIRTITPTVIPAINATFECLHFLDCSKTPRVRPS